MFQFRRFPAYAYLIQRTLHGYCPCGLPHSEIPGSMDICSSPRLIAACHVLRRLLMPRHSPCALYSLTNRKHNCSRCELCRLHRFFEIVIVTLHPFGCCSTIKFTLPCFFKHRTSLLPYLSLSFTLFSFQGAFFPASFEARFEDPTFQSGLQIQQQIAVWWARVGSNHRPYDYQSYALAS